MAGVHVVRIIGQVLTPAGQPATGGKIKIELNSYGKVSHNGNETLVAQSMTVPIGLTGEVDFNLVANDLITPANTYYLFIFEVIGCLPWATQVQIVDTADPVYIGSLVDIGTPVQLSTVMFIPALDPLPDPGPTYARRVIAEPESVALANGTEQRVFICLRTADPAGGPLNNGWIWVTWTGGGI